MIDDQKQKEAQKTISFVLNFLNENVTDQQLFLSTCFNDPPLAINLSLVHNNQMIEILDFRNEIFIQIDPNLLGNAKITYIETDNHKHKLMEQYFSFTRRALYSYSFSK